MQYWKTCYMRRVAATYGFLLTAAPLFGIAVSRISTAIGEVEEASTTVPEKCVSSPVPFSPLRQTLLRPPLKHPKSYPAFWKTSKRQGLRAYITTLYSVHLHEAVPILAGQRPPEEVLNHFYRCRGFGTVYPLDPRLTDAIVAAAVHFHAERVEVISAYRSPKFNDSLAKKGRHVASESKHTKGQAMDIRIVGTPANAVGKWLFGNLAVGVGIYTADDFVHVDTGPKRRWRGR
jgi:hypothetical protein